MYSTLPLRLEQNLSTPLTIRTNFQSITGSPFRTNFSDGQKTRNQPFFSLGSHGTLFCHVGEGRDMLWTLEFQSSIEGALIVLC